MFSRSKTLIALSAFLMTIALVSGALAGEHRYRMHRIKHVSIRHVTIRNAIRNVDRRVIVKVGRDHPRYRVSRDVNTYSGDVAINSRNGVGSWSYGTSSAPADMVRTGTTLKIIDLTTGENDCSMERGVCVIRP